MMTKEINKHQETSMVTPQEQSVVTTDTRMIITESFAKAGPWAILSLILILAVGWEVHYFISQYVHHTAEAIEETNAVQKQLVKLTIDSQEMVRQNGVAVQTNSAALLQMMKHADEQMKPVAADRAQQTELLKQILSELKERPHQ